MEELAPFKLEELRRDWIVGVSGTEFFGLVKENIDFLNDGETDDLDRVVVLPVEEPVEFAAMFFAAVYQGVSVALANPNWGIEEQAQFDRLMNEASAERGSILIPTGGTSGGVKLAVHHWASLKASADAVCSFLGGTPIDSCCLLPLYHVSGLMQLVRSFVTGGSIRFDDEDVSGFCLSLVPTQLQRALLSDVSIQKLNTARAIFVGGAVMPQSMAQQTRELRLPVIQVYGMTETAAMVAAVPSQDFLDGLDVGAVPLGDAKFLIEEDGRIRIQTSALFRGYYGCPVSDLNEGFVVNDEGRIDEDGRLRVLGRVDRLINTGGEKVDPREVEAALLELDEVSEALVVGHEDEEWGQLVSAYIVADNLDGGLEWVRAQLRDRLATYKLPKVVSVVEKLPLDARGKFIRPEQRG